MKINELRIGNLFQDKEGKTLVCQGVCDGGIDEPTIVWYDVDSGKFLDLEECFPIKMSPQWFYNFGFSNKNEIPERIEIECDLGKITIYSDGRISTCEYVHQFQNICFAFTGTELKLN